MIVANARKIPAITASESKNDRNDAEQLARFWYGKRSQALLVPLEHRSQEQQQDVNVIQVRSTLVRARTMLVNALRGLTKSAGGRLPCCSTESLPTRVRAHIPSALTAAVGPLLEQIAQLNRQIAALDRQIDKLREKYPEVGILRTAPGVGPVVAAAYVLTLGRPDSGANRSAGAFLGLRPRQSQSGDCDPQMRITRAGDIYLRSLLVKSAQDILGGFGPDSALRRVGAEAGRQRRQARRKTRPGRYGPQLAVLLHSMWRSGECFQPFPQPPAAVPARA